MKRSLFALLFGIATLAGTAAPAAAQNVLTINYINGEGGSVACSAPCYGLPGTVVTLTVTVNPGYTFVGWETDFGTVCSGNALTCTYTFPGNGNSPNITAIFLSNANPTYPLTVELSPPAGGAVVGTAAGIICANTYACTFDEPLYSTITLTAVPNIGYGFAGWGIACSGSSPTCMASVNYPTAVTASFSNGQTTQQTYPVTVTVVGSGMVTSSPPGINCPGTCTAQFLPNLMITLTATSIGSNTFFNGWTGNCSPSNQCTFELFAPTTETANFLTNQYVLTVGTAYGTVTSNPAGINCPGTCSAIFTANSIVTLTETPDKGFAFLGWEALCPGTGTTCQIYLSSNQSASAIFGLPLAVTVIGKGTVTGAFDDIDCPGYYCSTAITPGSTIALNANPAEGQTLLAWGGACSGNTTCTFTQNTAEAVSAQFIPATGVTPSAGYWWNPDQPGSGFVLETQGSSLFMGAFLYSPSGEATWLAANGSMTSQSEFSGPLAAYSGGQTLTGAYVAPTLSQQSPGNISISFNDNGHGAIATGGITLPIQRFDFGPGGAAAPQSPANPQTGWWWNTAEPGRGFAIEVQGTTMYLAGYMYDSAGNPTWYVATGTMTESNAFIGTWELFAGGNPAIGQFRAAQLSNANPGGVTLQFTDNSHAVLTLPGGRQIPLTRFVFGQ
jgi:hypothetical protein